MFYGLASPHGTTDSQPSVDPYSAWAAALRLLRENWGNGERPEPRQLPGYLSDVPPDQRSEAAQDLIAEHLRLGWSMGRGCGLEAYLAAFHDLAFSSSVPVDLVEDEFLARYLRPHGDTPSVDDYHRRFPGRTDIREMLEQRCLGHGRYVKLRKRGQGAMGDVSEAYDHHLGRLVAIKEPKAGLVDARGVPASSSGWHDNPDLLRRFADEARITAGLEHPSIVSVHEYHPEDDATPFYVMRLVNGQPFGERIRAYHHPTHEIDAGARRLLRHELLRSFVAVCDAMAYAHAQGVLHRDLKPGNVIVGGFGETVILDWGMGIRLPSPDTALATSSAAPSPRLVVGTPDYMPPEQADGKADVRSDVFGLGAILYEVLTGQSPQGWPEGARPSDWQRRVREAQFQPPHRVRSHAPPALEAVCLKALSRNPANRYASAGDLAREVCRYLAGEPVAAWSEPASAKFWTWLCGRRP